MIQQPPQIFIKLQDEINKACRLDDVPEVWLSDQLDEDIAGLYNCQNQQIFIDKNYYFLSGRVSRGSLYLHEVAHHLTTNKYQSHGPIFGAIYGALLIRWLGHGGGVRAYDVQDQDLDQRFFFPTGKACN